MRTGVLFLTLLGITAVVATRPAAADDSSPDSLVLSGDTNALFGPALMQTDAPDLAAAPSYTPHGTTLGRFDPSQLRILGGEIGGGGVQGGAIVSLSWPTQR